MLGHGLTCASVESQEESPRAVALSAHHVLHFHAIGLYFSPSQVVILAREAGLQLQIEDVSVTSLVPDPLRVSRPQGLGFAAHRMTVKPEGYTI